MSERPLPASDEAERTLIASCIIDPSRVDEALALTSWEEFHIGANRRLFEAITELRALGVAIDAVPLAGWLRKHGWGQATPTYIHELLGLQATTGNIKEYARIIHDSWRLRELYATCTRIASEIEHGANADDAQAYLDESAAAIAEIGRSPQVSGAEWIGDSLRNTFEELRDRAKNGFSLSGMASGYSKLDNLLDGLQSGRVVVVAGRPGMGKSALAQSISLNVAKQGHGVAFFSLEIPKSELSRRAMYAESKIDAKDMQNCALSREDWSRMTQAAIELNKLPLIWDDSSLTYPQLRAKITQIKAELERKGAPLKLVVVDHLLLLGREKMYRDTRQQLEANTKRCKDLAKELDVCMVELSQLNRSVESRATKDRHPQLSDLRESGSIEQDADVVILLYRPDYYEQDSDKHTHEAQLLVAKNRCGPTGYVRLHFEAKYTRFDNLEQGEGM
jgi:replicative DNA helicase